MKFKLGAIVATIVVALLVFPPVISLVSAETKPTELIMQLDSSTVIKNDETVTITDDLQPIRIDNSTMLPLRWFAENIGLTVGWNDDTREVTLTDDENELNISFVVGSSSITSNNYIISLDTPTTLVGDVTYVPMRAFSEYFGFTVYFVDDVNGGFIFMSNEEGYAEPTDSEIASVLAILGPSKVQMFSGSVMGRVGSGTILIDCIESELAIDAYNFSGVIYQNDAIYMPVITSLDAIGIEYQIVEDGGLNITVDNQLEEISADNLHLDENDMLYVSAEALSEALGLSYNESDNAFTMTVHDLSNFPTKAAYLISLAKNLADQRSDVPEASAYVAFTFDDGPTGGTEGLTAQLLDGLQERGATATFFMCGYRIKDFNSFMDRYDAEGHEIANHTMNHPQSPILSKMSQSEIYNEIMDTSDLIASYTGHGTSIMRPVGGSLSDTLSAAMVQADHAIINWSVDTLDWKNRDATSVKNIIVNNAEDGDIILMHDLYPTTVEGALAAIDILKEQGYAFVTVSELARIKGVTLEPGKVYTRIDTVEA